MRWQPMSLSALSILRETGYIGRRSTCYKSAMTTSTPSMEYKADLKRPQNPLIVILGATGTGKSNLALSIAQSVPSGAEIINCDAMQMYRSLPIITNKLRVEERRDIPHHLLDFIGLDETPWTVNKFVKESSKIIEEVRARGKIPMMVGGTGYYAFGSLFKDSMLGDDVEGNEGTEGLSDAEKQEFGEGDERLEILNGSTDVMLEKLRELDPEMASSWHPKDRRKIQRSLEICLKQGRKASEIYRAQVGGSPAGMDASNGEYGAAGGLRYDTLILWLSASDVPLKSRLNARVDQMVRDGLFEEALELAYIGREFQERNIKVDKSKGIWVSIGYKEMESWAVKYIDDPEKCPEDGKLAQECIESVKAGTRQYAKRQDRYIRIRLANALKKAGAFDRLFLLDGTDLSCWKDNVDEPAQRLVATFLAGAQLPQASSLGNLAKENFDKIEAQGDKLSYRVAHYCEICDKTTMTEKEWAGHLASRSHKKVVQSKKRKALTAVKNEDMASKVEEEEVQ